MKRMNQVVKYGVGSSLVAVAVAAAANAASLLMSLLPLAILV
ncbi:hypothetical protein [Vitreoscilla sp. C1]|nr:hypothetical protein [Vitreoscilla sp. C1]